MNTYQNLQHKALGLAFILAPLLMVIGSAAFVLGIGVTPFGTDSWVDGLLIAYAFLLMVPVTLELARMLGQRAPAFGLICAILGLGWGMSTVPAALKIMQMGIIEAGLNQSVWSIMDTAPAALLLILPSMLAIVGFLALGVGLLWKGGISRWAALLMIVGSALYFLGVAGGADIAVWQTKVFTPLATVAYLAALAPIGLRYLTGDSKAYELETAVA